MKSLRRNERKRKDGRDNLALSDDTARKLSALLWYNGNDKCCTSTDSGIKTDDSKTSKLLQQKTLTKDDDHENSNNNNNNGLKHCIVEITEDHLEMKNVGNDEKGEKIRRSNDDDTPKKQPNEVRVEILHHGKCGITLSK